MYIDGSQVDYTQPLQLQYGIHSIQITADGYDTWSKRLYVNSPEAQIEIALSGDDTGSTETESTETAGMKRIQPWSISIPTIHRIPVELTALVEVHPVTLMHIGRH